MNSKIEGSDFDFDRDLDPIDMQQLEVLAKMPIEARRTAPLGATEWVFMGIRGAMQNARPEWSERRVRLEALAWVTPLRGKNIRAFIEYEPD